ncbi:MAG: hypothetical protein AAFR77_09300 [Cyanobacteria bacterium J06631_2]
MVWAKSFVISSFILVSQFPTADPKFIQLQKQLESYGFKVNIGIPPEYNSSQQPPEFRRRIRKPYGLLHSKSKSVWINPIVFELGNSIPTIIHESVHAAQYCAGDGNLQTLNLDLKPIPQASPFFKRYSNVQRQDLEREAYTIQTQPNSYELAQSLLDKHCQRN